MSLTLNLEPVRRRVALTSRDYGVDSSGDEFITLNYLRYHPNSKRTQSFLNAKVRIHGSGAWWRAKAQGYTLTKTEAGVFDFAEAVNYTDHIGPEKGIRYQKVNDA